MSRGILGRLGDFLTGVVLLTSGAVIIYFMPGSLAMFGPVLAAGGCVFLVTAVSD